MVLKKYIIVSVVTVIGFLLSFISLLSAYIYQPEYPFWDMILIIQFLEGTITGEIPNLLLGDGFQLGANEHMPILPLFIWKLDYILFDSRGKFPLLVSFGLVISIAWLLAREFTKNSDHNSFFCIAFAVNLALLTSPVHYNNIAWEHQLLIYMSLALSLFAFSLASRSVLNQRQKVVDGGKIGLLAAGATFSFGYGLFVWPALLLQMILAKWSWRRAVPVLTCLLTSIFFYILLNEDSSRQLSRSMSLSFLFDLFIATLELAALPITALFSFKFSQSYSEIAIGLLFLSVAFFFIFDLIRTGWRNAMPSYQFVALILVYCIGIFAVTYYSRVSIWSGFVNIPSRYVVVSTIFLICMPVAFFGIFRFDGSLRVGCFFLPSYILLFLMALIMFPSWLTMLEHQYMKVRISSVYTEFDVAHVNRFPEFWDVGNVFFRNNLQETWASYKRRNAGKDHVFIFERTKKKVPPEWLVASTIECDGSFESIKEVSPRRPNLVAYHGWVLPSQKLEGKAADPEWIVAVDVDTNKVVGIGVAGIDPQLLRLDREQPVQREKVGFIGFARLASTKKVKFLLISNNNAVCNMNIDK